MKRKLLSTVLAVTMAVSRLTGCGQSGTNEATGTGATTTDAKTETYRVRIPIDSCDFSLAHYEADGEEAQEAVFCRLQTGKRRMRILNTFLLKEWKNTFCHCWMRRRKLTAGSWISSCPPMESAGLHEDQWRAEQRRQIKAGIPEALGRVYLPLH